MAYLWAFLWSSQCLSTGRVERNKDNFDVFLEGVLFLCENVKKKKTQKHSDIMYD